MIDVAIFLAEGFEEIEALTVVDVLRRADIKCDMFSLQGDSITGSHGIKVKADKTFSDKTVLDRYGCIVLPGGMPGSKNLMEDDNIIELVKDFYVKGKLVAAICAAPIVLNRAGVIKGKRITSYPAVKDQLKDCIYSEEIVVKDSNIITSRGPATAINFALKIVESIKEINVSNSIRESMMFKFLESEIKNS